MAGPSNYSRLLEQKISFQASSRTASVQQDMFLQSTEDNHTLKTCDKNGLCSGEAAESGGGQIRSGNKNGFIIDFLL